ASGARCRHAPARDRGHPRRFPTPLARRVPQGHPAQARGVRSGHHPRQRRLRRAQEGCDQLRVYRTAGGGLRVGHAAACAGRQQVLRGAPGVRARGRLPHSGRDRLCVWQERRGARARAGGRLRVEAGMERHRCCMGEQLRAPLTAGEGTKAQAEARATAAGNGSEEKPA
ncbi:unnamed protein product, partial [Ectocarpus fasciculatus]